MKRKKHKMSKTTKVLPGKKSKPFQFLFKWHEIGTHCFMGEKCTHFFFQEEWCHWFFKIYYIGGDFSPVIEHRDLFETFTRWRMLSTFLISDGNPNIHIMGLNLFQSNDNYLWSDLFLPSFNAVYSRINTIILMPPPCKLWAFIWLLLIVASKLNIA